MKADQYTELISFLSDKFGRIDQRFDALEGRVIRVEDGLEALRHDVQLLSEGSTLKRKAGPVPSGSRGPDQGSRGSLVRGLTETPLGSNPRPLPPEGRNRRSWALKNADLNAFSPSDRWPAVPGNCGFRYPGCYPLSPNA